MSEGQGRCWIVSGRVQGVGFRWFVRQRALEANLVGYTRNLPDGRVEVAAFGPPESLDAIRSAIAEGPPLASVREVTDASYPKRVNDYATFEIR